ncbi:MAG: hypothetical protein HY092_00560 [Candidatus Kerfeldbacteria bacterium]|nr:hypothetical protein [Candidatus Kerfeldbacteria bacterium]
MIAQAVHVLQEAKAPLIIIPRNPSTDDMASSLALAVVLDTLGKKSVVVSPEFRVPARHDFLPNLNRIVPAIPAAQNLIIRLDVKKEKLDTLSYEVINDILNIYLTPKIGRMDPDKVQIASGPHAYDCVITISVEDPKTLGPVYEQHLELFVHQPTVNIDHRPTNTRHGHVNLVDVTASSSAEIIFSLTRALGLELLDEPVATSLLAGIISKTAIFQNQQVTPRALAAAAQLMNLGGRREEVVKQLYQTKSVNTLKVWGRALEHMETMAQGKAILATLSRADLAQTATTTEEASGVIGEVLINAPDARFICLCVEQAQGADFFLQHPTEFTPGPNWPKLVFVHPTQMRGHLDASLADSQARLKKLLEAAVLT